jgi:hypothetical protein
MANEKISQMPLISTFASGDLFPIVDISEASAADRNKSVTFGELFRNVLGGSASDPSIAFTGDQNTGIYSPGADQVAVATNGAGRLFVDSAGLVGIGSSTPTQRLTVAGNILTASAAGTDSYINVATTGVQNTYLGFNNSGSTNTNAVLNNYSYVGAGNPYGLQLLANGTPAVTIDTSQRVGIGTTSPSTTLSIGASASSSYNGGVCLNRGPSTYNFYEASDGTNSVIFGLDNTLTTAKIGSVNSYPLGFFTSNTEKARIDASGRFLVGTSTVTTTASSSTNNLLAVESANNYLGVSFTANCNDSNGSYLVLKKSRGTIAGSTTVVQSGDEIGNIFFEATDGSASRSAAAIRAFVDATPGANDMPGRLVFSTTSDGASSPTERLRIDSSGRLLVGTSTGTSRLSIAGTADNANSEIQITATGIASGYIGANSNGLNIGTDTAGLVFKTGVPGGGSVGASGTERMRIDNSGRLLVGTSSSVGSNALSQISGVGSGTRAKLELFHWEAGGGASQLIFSQSRGGSFGSYTAVNSGDELGGLFFQGSNGSAFGTGARIDAVADAAWGSGDHPARLVFSTTADGASSPTGRAQINNRGAFYMFAAAGGDGHALMTGEGPGTTYYLFAGFQNVSAVSGASAVLVFQVFTNGNVENTNNSYGAISDIKLKENIVAATSQWNDLKALQVRKYNFKEGQTHTQIGLVAQEAELVSPGLVYETPDRDAEGNDLGTVTKSVNYSVLYMKAVKALQEAMERIETLEGMVAVNNITIDEQQHQLSTLAARLTALENA